MFKSKKIIELGAGTALGSITAALVGAESVLITDRPGESELLMNIESSIVQNGLQNCRVVCKFKRNYNYFIMPAQIYNFPILQIPLESLFLYF
jgi:predicted nicotinamide N-methyase